MGVLMFGVDALKMYTGAAASTGHTAVRRTERNDSGQPATTNKVPQQDPPAGRIITITVAVPHRPPQQRGTAHMSSCLRLGCCCRR